MSWQIRTGKYLSFSLKVLNVRCFYWTFLNNEFFDGFSILKQLLLEVKNLI